MPAKKRSRGLGEATRTVTQLKSAATRCGSHFFDKATMKHWNSKVEGVYAAPRERATYFVTSEVFNPGESRKYTIRRLHACSVKTVGKQGEYGGVRGAREAAREYARGKSTPTLSGARRRKGRR